MPRSGNSKVGGRRSVHARHIYKCVNKLVPVEKAFVTDHIRKFQLSQLSPFGVYITLTEAFSYLIA